MDGDERTIEIRRVPCENFRSRPTVVVGDDRHADAERLRNVEEALEAEPPRVDNVDPSLERQPSIPVEVCPLYEQLVGRPFHKHHSLRKDKPKRVVTGELLEVRERVRRQLAQSRTRLAVQKNEPVEAQLVEDVRAVS